MLLFSSLIASGQLAMPDTVCVGAMKYYWVSGEPGSTYIWSLTDPFNNMTILPSTSDSVMITWNMVPGIYNLSTIQHSTITNCDGLPISANIVLFDQPTAFAGNPMTLCAPGPYQLSAATAANYSHLKWTKSGDGTFDNDTILHPFYTPGTNDLLAGSVTLTLTAQGLGKGNGCTPAISSVVIHQSAEVVAVTAAATNVSCYGGNDGTATAIPTGGTGTYTFLWNDPATQTTITATGLYAGTYTVIVTDANGCADTVSVTVSQPAAGLTVTTTHVNVLCFGDATGNATAIPAGGTSPYTYSWNTVPVQTTFTASNLVAGTYIVIVTDTNNCTATGSVTITQPPSIMASAGPDKLICETQSYTFSDATAANYSSLTWTTSGNGSFNDTTVLNPVYTPGSADITAGNVTLTLIAHGIVPCPDISDSMVLTISRQAIVNAGPDDSICATQPSYQLSSALATHYTSLLWTTSGKGTFNDSTAQNPIYTASSEDILSGLVQLTLSANSAAPCVTVTDAMKLRIIPEVLASAGSDTSTCRNVPITISGSSASNFSSILWTLNGSGTLINASSIHPTYIAGLYESGLVILTMKVHSIQPCTDSIVDQMAITIYPVPGGTLSGNSTICEKDTVVMTLTFFGTPPISVTYTNGVDTTTITNIMTSPYSIIFTPPTGNWIYTLIALNDIHCAAPPDQLLGSAHITVFPLPAVEFTWNIGNQNNEIQFHIDSTITNLGAIGYMCLWNFGDGIFGYGHNPIHVYPTSYTYIVTLTVTDTLGCINSVTHLVFVPLMPTAFFASNSPVCFGQEACFTNLSSNPLPPDEWITTYIWDYGDGLPNDTIYLPNNPNTCHHYFTIGTYAVTLKVIDNHGFTDSYTANVFVMPDPVANFIYSPALCPDQHVSFTDASTPNGGASIFSWNWNFADPGSGIHNTSNLVNPTHIFTHGDSTYNVRLIVVNFNNCTDTMIKPIYIHPKPPVNYTSDTACLNQLVHFMADTIVTHLDSIVSWSWNFGDGTPLSTAPINTSHIFTAVGAYTVTLTITDLHGCMNSVSYTIDVNPLPVAAFSWTAPTCHGSAIQFTDGSHVSTIFAGYVAKWMWEFGDGNSQTISLPNSPNISHTYIGPTLSYTVRLTVWTNDSCTSFTEKTINLIPAPTANFETSAVHCENQPVQFTDLTQTNGGGNIIQWSWNFGEPSSGANNFSTLQNPTHSYQAAGTYTVMLAVNNVSNCHDTILKTININIKPVANFTADTVCLGNPTAFTDLSVPNAPTIILYSWDFGDGSPLNPQTNPTHTYAYSGFYTVTLSIVNLNGCTHSVSKQVLVNPLPISAFTFSTPNCLGTPACFTNMSTTPPGYLGNIIQWTWNFGDGTTQVVDFPNNPNVCHIFTDAALGHVVRLTVMTSDSCTHFAEHTVNSVPSPIANFTNSTTTCAGQTVKFTDLSQMNGGGQIISWHWDFGEPSSGASNFSTLQNPAHNYAIGGTYNVTLIINNISYCADTIVKAVGINQLPVAAFTADTVCFNNPTTFNSSSSVANATYIISYSWDFGDGSPANIQPNPIHLYSNYGLYTVTLTIVNSNSCTASASKQTLVRPLPIPEFTFTTPSCLGAIVNFTNMSSTVPGYMGAIVTWVWHFGDGTPDVTINFPASPNVSHIFAGTALIHIVRLTVTTADTCTNFIEHTVNSVSSPIANFGYPSVNCIGQSVQFNDMSQMNGNDPIITWSWNFGDPTSGSNNTSNAQNPVHIFSGSGNFNVTLIVTNSTGCADTTVPAKVVTVNAKPVANFTANTACLTSLTTFQNTSTTASGSISGYLWNFGDGGTSAQQNPTHLYASSGTFNVTLTVTTSGGCTHDTTKQVIVNPNPVALFNFISPTCLGDSVYFTDLSTTPGNPIVNWKWDFGDGQLASIDYPTSPNMYHKYANAGIFNVKLTVRTQDSCSHFIILPVTIQAKPATNFGFATIRCELMPVQFTDLSQGTGGAPVISWVWNFGDPTSGSSNTSTVKNPSHSFTAAGSYNVHLIVTNVNGCVNAITKAVSVNTLPVAQFTADTACVGTATQFTDGSTAGSGNLATWLWNFGEPSSGTNNTSTQQNPTHAYSAAGTYNVKLLVTNSNSCERDTLIPIHVNPKPQAMFEYTASCVGDSTHFTDLSIAPGSQITNWLWNFGDGGTSALQNPNHAYAAAGTYNVHLLVTNLAGCTDSVVMSVIARAKPIAAFIYTSFFCPKGQVNFQDQSQGIGAPIAERLWIFEPGYTSNSVNPTYTFSVTDTTYIVTLIVTDNYGCQDTISDSIHIKPGFGFTFNNNTACFGDPTHFTPQNLTPGDSLFFVTWDFGDPASGSNNISHTYRAVHTFTHAGAFIVKMKAWNWDNCVDSVYKSVIVHESPQILFTSTSKPCDNVVQFTDNSLPGNGTITQWEWTFGDGTSTIIILSPGPGDISHIYMTPGDYTVTLKVTNSNGCFGSFSHLVQTVPCITSSFTVEKLSCARCPVIFSDGSLPVSIISSWHWFWGDGSDSIYSKHALKVKHEFASPGDYIVKLVIKAGTGTTQFTDTATQKITIGQTPEAFFSNVAVCMNKTTLFRDTSETFGEQTISWNWNFGEPSSGSLNISSGQNPSHKYSTAGIYAVKLLVMNKFGCKDSLIKPTRVFGIPKAAFASSAVCVSNPTYFFDQSKVADTLTAHWLWNFGDPYSGSGISLLKDPVHKYRSVGDYLVRLLVEDCNGCNDTCDSIIRVNPSPVSLFTLTENVNGMPGKIQLNNQSSGANSYLWDLGNGHSDTTENPVVTYTMDGTYLIMLISYNQFNCTDTSYYKHEMLFKGLFVPNAFAPASSNQSVMLFKPVGKNLKQYNIQVYDAWGHLLWESSKIDPEGRPVEGWDGTYKGTLMPPSTYLWKVSATFIDGTIWQGSDIGKGEGKTIGTVSLIR